MSDPVTLAVYEREAEAYARRVSDWHDPCLDAFIAALPPGAAVLDLGCGPGHAAARMAAAGLSVTAVDACPAMLRRAARHKGVTVRQARFDEIEGTALFDGIWASFSLLHAPRAALHGHLAALHRACRPDERLHLAMKLGTGEATDRLGRFYAYYTQGELDALLRGAGFTPVAHVTGSGAGLSGEVSDWIAIAAHA